MVFDWTKLLLHIANRSARIVCLGCFIKALKVSSSLYRDTKKNDFSSFFFLFFFYKNTHHKFKHTHTHTQHAPTMHPFFISARLCNCKNTQSGGFFQRRGLYCFYRSTIQYVDNKRFDCLNRNSTHFKLGASLSMFFSLVLRVCVFQTLWFTAVMVV